MTQQKLTEEIKELKKENEKLKEIIANILETASQTIAREE